MKTNFTRLYGDLPPPLTQEEELEMFRRKMSGDEDARQRLIECNMRLVLYIVKRAARSAEDLEEMSSEGMMALMRSVDMFDPTAGVRFSSYASMAVKNAIRYMWRKQRPQRDMCSLESQVAIRKDGRVLCVEDCVADNGDIEEAVMTADDYRYLRDTIKRLPERSQRLLYAYYGFDGQTPRLQMELQDVLHIRQSSISRMKARTLKQLRSELVKAYQ